ncbi:MAG: hypothetical protein IJN37_08840 [Clostridia bacterium]|nr:hypothetical protein [Clostridia bacterium]
MKKTLSFTLLFTFLLSSLFSINISAVHPTSFEEYFEPFYNGGHSSYSIIDLNGLDVTLSFLDETSSLYVNGNWDAISDYFNENVSEVSKININRYPQVARGRELPKSTTIDYIVLRDIESTNNPLFNNSRIRVFYSLTYELYYDEDTHQVVRALAPRMSNPSFEFVYPTSLYLQAIMSCSLNSAYANISSGQSSVEFYHSFNVSLHTTDIVVTDAHYGTISSSYTMRV